MGTKAYLLVETAVGKTRDVASTLRNLDGVTSVDVVTGPYDIIAVIGGTDMAVVGNIGDVQIQSFSSTASKNNNDPPSKR